MVEKIYDIYDGDSDEQGEGRTDTDWIPVMQLYCGGGFIKDNAFNVDVNLK